MLNADFRAGDFLALPAASAGASARVSSNGAGAGFGSLYRELNQEVSRFIEQGGGAASLSPEGRWSRLQAQGVAGSGTADLSALDAVSETQRQAFVDEVLPLAREAAGRLGVAPEVLTAQAALETGWGRAPVRRADGSSSNNLFGIKAGSSWGGEVVQAATTEFEQGQAVAASAAFRGYASPAQSFDDLARLLSGSPRYQAALGTGADARAYGTALQRGGYATDPAYADKLAQVAGRIAGRSAVGAP